MREKFRETGLPCPCGQSSDAYCERQDSSGFCFSCHKNFPAKGGPIIEATDITYEYLSARGISKKTHEKYGVLTKIGKINGEDTVLGRGFPYGEGTFKFKRDNVPRSEKYLITGQFQKATLFGLDKFDRGSRPSITIFEGEDDALAGSEMLNDRSACVSLKSGAGSAFNDLSRPDIYEKVNSFDKIYICFDNDQAGQEAVKAIQGLFDFQKVYLVKLDKFKDAQEYIENKSSSDFEATWKSAKRYAPDNIISSFSDIESALNTSSEDLLSEYFLPKLNEMLYGIHAGEVIVVKAPEGVGKTEFFRAQEYFALQNCKFPIGIIHLEEDNATTIKAIAGYELEVPAVLPDCGLSREDILEGYKKAVRDDEGRVHIHSSFDVEDEQSFMGNIRFLVSAAGCRLIFLDHISWLGTGLSDDDERKKLDRISQKLKLLAKELRFGLIEISHVNDDGKTRGSRNITKVANTVIHLERNVEDGENEATVIVQKARLSGRTGPAGKMYFSRAKGKMMHEPDVILPKEVE